ncbi:MAG: hypothetical protein IT379_26630, partial [Deltaproteobacteria bacterium]|nr:hypothetical protein [Deltaproteobacteria bacterium]
MTTTSGIACALTVLLLGCGGVDDRAADGVPDAAGDDPDSWMLQDAAAYLPPPDGRPRPPRPCTEGVTRRRIDGLPGVLEGYPGYKLAADGP